ncbi:MAG: hypothetical protein ABIZ91_16835 [Gemmatimonadaceae bacterium]
MPSSMGHDSGVGRSADGVPPGHGLMSAREVVGRAVTGAIDLARAVRPATREGERHYNAGLRFRKRARSWTEAQRLEWTLQRLREVVRKAATDSPFYAARFKAAGFDPAAPFSFDDFARVPLLERADVAEHSARMLSPGVPASLRRKDGTGGSSGEPLTYWSGPEERGWRLSGQDDFMRCIGVPRGVSTAFLWGHHIDRSERTAWRERARDRLTNRRWFDCFRLSPEVLMGYHEALSRFRPASIVAYASALDALATVLLERGLTANYPVHRIVTGAEKLWPAQRARIERAFPVAVHERYGSREMGLIAAQFDAATSPSLEVDWGNVLVEPEGDATDSPIIVTKLHADAMPMIRYRIGDRARFPAGSAPGHPTWRLEEVLGRQLDGLHHPDGHWIHGVGIPHLMKDLPVREFQIRQNADYTIDVLLIPHDAYSPAAGEHILKVLGDNLPGLTMRLQLVDDIPRTGASKWRPVITHAAARDVPVAARQEN